jgi:hypothetical protein
MLVEFFRKRHSVKSVCQSDHHIQCYVHWPLSSPYCRWGDSICTNNERWKPEEVSDLNEWKKLLTLSLAVIPMTINETVVRRRSIIFQQISWAAPYDNVFGKYHFSRSVSNYTHLNRSTRKIFNNTKRNEFRKTGRHCRWCSRKYSQRFWNFL